MRHMKISSRKCSSTSQGRMSPNLLFSGVLKYKLLQRTLCSPGPRLHPEAPGEARPPARPCLPGVPLRVPAPPSNSEPGACLPAAVTASHMAVTLPAELQSFHCASGSACPRLPYNLTVSEGLSQEERYKQPKVKCGVARTQRNSN